MRDELNSRQAGPLKVAIINGVCLKADAISQSVHGTAVALRDALGAECKVFTYRCEFPDLLHRIVSSPVDIVTDQDYLGADLVLFHFGIYYDLFNSILIAPLQARKVVRYHNITPKEFLPASEHRLIGKSLDQRANIGVADEVWADSEYNRQDLISYGIDPSRIVVSPLFVKFSGDESKPKRTVTDPVELLYVGRFVQSKGVHDLISAIATLPADCPPVQLRMVGNVDLSDAAYVAKIREEIDRLPSGHSVVFEGKVADERLQRCFIDADVFIIPSYHEGFCVPLIEAMRFGCVPIASDAGNLPNLISGMGPVIKAGDVPGLVRAITDVARGILQSRGGSDRARTTWGQKPQSWKSYRAALAEHVREFEFDTYKRRVTERVKMLTERL